MPVGPCWGHWCCPGPSFTQGTKELFLSQNTTGMALLSGLRLFPLISEEWNCIRAIMFQSPGRKGKWAAAGCECWWHCRAVPSCMCQPGVL